MTDKEVLERAKEYIVSLSNGVDPITRAQIPQNETVRNERISKCLKYVSKVLQQVIDNGGAVSRRVVGTPFEITDEELKRYKFSDDPIGINEIAKRINALVSEAANGKLNYTAISRWLEAFEYLEMTESNGARMRRPSLKGRAIGIIEEERSLADGRSYTAVLYSKKAQRFIIDNLQEMIK